MDSEWNMKIPRRRFIKFVTFGTAASVVAGKLWQCELLAYCDPPAGAKDGVFKVRVSDYPALSQDFGSVRLGLNPVGFDNRPDGMFHPFLVNRDDFGNFYVLDCECRHQGCSVPTFDSAELGMRCPCHQSLYGIDGEVLEGPTTKALHHYPFELDGDIMTIQIPCWGFEIKAVALPGGPNSRIRIDFEAFQNTTYEVKFRKSLNDPWVTADFSITPTGPTDRASVTTFAGPMSVYLDRTTVVGYFAIGVRLSEI